MDVHSLVPLAVYLVRLGHHNFLNKLVDALRHQLRQPRHLSGPLNKPLQVSGFVCGGVQAGLHLRDSRFQLPLLGFQRYRQRGEAFFGQQALGHILVAFQNKALDF